MDLRMSAHICTVFDADLQDLMRLVAEMGGLAELQIMQAVDALTQRDIDLALQVINRDPTIDAIQAIIEEKGISIISLYNPLAIDLRDAISALHICNDLERIGDLAKNISKRTIAIGSERLPKSLVAGIEHMTQLVLEQLKAALDSYATRNAREALAVRNGDLQIDALNNALFHETLTNMGEDPHSIVAGAHVLFCIKNLERIGDHATNIAEAVHYIVSGHVPANERPKGNTTSLAAVNA